MKTRITLVEIMVILCTIACLLLAIGGAIIGPVMESRAYNRITGAKTTWWDAVWLELRVQESPKTNE